MIFDWSGLKQHQYFILKQIPDPLKHCNYAIPIPLPIGLPFMPCDLPNEYELYETDQTYTQVGNIYLTFQQEVSFHHRILLPASHRPWQITGKDYYHHVPYEGVREANCCFSPEDRPSVKVRYQDKYIGKVTQNTILNCCCFTQIYQQFIINSANGTPIYRIVSKNPQNGHFCIFPFWNFDKIKYQIYKITQTNNNSNQQTNNQIQQNEIIIQEEQEQSQQLVGEIVHLFNGFGQYTSKNDKYGIKFPQAAGEEDKCLIVYCVFLIDYLLFCNF